MWPGPLPEEETLIRPLTEQDLPAAFGVLRQLRPHLSWELFRERLARQESDHGYKLLGAFWAGQLVGVLGMRQLETMARGSHLHVDDLVVSEQVRQRGIGRLLLSRAEELAQQSGLGAVYLDSRPEALGFYASQGYEPRTSTLVRKVLESGG